MSPDTSKPSHQEETMKDVAARRLVHFVHGKESGPWGRKIKAMAEVARQSGWAIDSLDYAWTTDPALRLEQLASALRGHDGPLVLVGSSMGGWVALEAARLASPRGVFLLAPALGMPHYPTPGRPVPVPTEIVHGWADDVVPAQHSIRFAEQHHCPLHLIPGGHRLDEQIPAICQLFHAFLHRMPV